MPYNRAVGGDSEPDQLRTLLRQTVAAELPGARGALASLRGESPSDGDLLELRNFFHGLAGSAGAAGMPTLGRLAAMCERVADLALLGQPVDRAFMLQSLGDGVIAVEEMLSDGPEVGVSQPVDLGLPGPTDHDRELPRILVIDDDRLSAEYIDRCLRAAGFRAIKCHEADAAFRAMEEQIPDLILLDVMMPDLDGFELCRRVRSNPAMQFTPIIFVTRRGELEERVRGLEVGGNDYIPKPFQPRELVARVRAHLHRLAALREVAIRDGLTRCFNRNYFTMRLQSEIARSHRYDHSLVVGLLDVDHFKTINDTHGHGAGDLVLTHLSRIIEASVRSTDIVARYGGDEFGVLMVHARAPEAKIVANRMGEQVEHHSFDLATLPDARSVQLAVTISVGATELRPDDTADSVLARADAALYEAKDAGRNTVRLRE